MLQVLKRTVEMVVLSTNNKHFDLEIRKILKLSIGNGADGRTDGRTDGQTPKGIT